MHSLGTLHHRGPILCSLTRALTAAAVAQLSWWELAPACSYLQKRNKQGSRGQIMLVQKSKPVRVRREPCHHWKSDMFSNKWIHMSLSYCKPLTGCFRRKYVSSPGRILEAEFDLYHFQVSSKLGQDNFIKLSQLLR